MKKKPLKRSFRRSFNYNWKKLKVKFKKIKETVTLFLNRLFAKPYKAIKKTHKQLKYLDKTKARFFLVTTVISFFTLYVAGTYAYFEISKYLDASIITIARLQYSLSSTSDRYDTYDKSVTLNSGETLNLKLTLKSLNSEKTKYALNFTSDSSDVKVYYSEQYKNNMSGEIGNTNSEIDFNLVLINSSSESKKVSFELKGGYLQNVLATNINEGYFPSSDLIVRASLYDENLNNIEASSTFPSKESGYTYFKTECSKDVGATWDFNDWDLMLHDIKTKTTCDVYFKKPSNDIETYFQILKPDGTKEFVDSVPNDGTYTFNKVFCNNDANITWNTSLWEFNITDMSRPTICVAEFTQN